MPTWLSDPKASPFLFEKGSSSPKANASLNERGSTSPNQFYWINLGQLQLFEL